MDRYTTISSENTKLSTKRSETVGGMIFCNNLKISFLPLLVHKTFPNLLGYSAASCSIKSISYHNFKSLTKLRELWLLKNKIETIYSNTFEDLASLERLDLRKFSHARQSSDLKNVLIGLGGNNIKFMNGKAFLNLKVLTEVWLLQNSCISKYSFGLENIEEMAEEITKKCRFAEVPPSDLAGVEEIFNFECGKSFAVKNRLVSGVETKRGEWPFLVALKRRKGKQCFCGGSLITSQHVVTG